MTTNQLNHTQDIVILSSEKNLIQQTGIAELLLENKEEIYQELVFLPGPLPQDTSQNTVEFTSSTFTEQITTDTGQFIHWLVEPITFGDEFLEPTLPSTQSAHQGELNTPTIGKSLLLLK